MGGLEGLPVSSWKHNFSATTSGDHLAGWRPKNSSLGARMDPNTQTGVFFSRTPPWPPHTGMESFGGIACVRILTFQPGPPSGARLAGWSQKNAVWTFGRIQTRKRKYFVLKPRWPPHTGMEAFGGFACVRNLENITFQLQLLGTTWLAGHKKISSGCLDGSKHPNWSFCPKTPTWPPHTGRESFGGLPVSEHAKKTFEPGPASGEHPAGWSQKLQFGCLD